MSTVLRSFEGVEGREADDGVLAKRRRLDGEGRSWGWSGGRVTWRGPGEDAGCAKKTEV